MPAPNKKFRVQRANGAVIDGETAARCTAIWWRDLAALQSVVDDYCVAFSYQHDISDVTSVTPNPETPGAFFLRMLRTQINDTVRKAAEIRVARLQDLDLPDNEDTRAATVRPT